jgi:hypothetical protein
VGLNEDCCGKSIFYEHPLVGRMSLEIHGFECSEVTKNQFEEGLMKWPKTHEECVKRAELFKSFQKKVKENPFTTKIKEEIANLEPLLRQASATEKESYSQVCFQGSPWSQLNSIPFALTALSFYKSWIVPGTSFLIPVMALLMPYILLKTFMNIPISFSVYTGILWRMWNGQPLPRTPEDFVNPPPSPPQDALAKLKQLAQNGWTLFTFGQSIYQPIQQARHFRKLDAETYKLGQSVIRVKEFCRFLITDFQKYLPDWFPEWVSHCPNGVRESFAYVIDNPFWLKHVLRAIGRFEVLWSLAERPDVVPVEFINSKKPVLMLRDFGDPAIPTEKRIVSSLKLTGHGIVTGPNRGGKSSFLRGVLANVKLAHTFGCAFAGKAQMSHFTWIADGLRLDDKPGKESMFEREVAFASGVLQKTEQKGKGLVLYDELFHSTNPPDAKRTSELFCDKLWKSNTCVSLVSTHIYSLAHKAPPSVKKVCLAAWKNKEGKYTFSYTAQKGVCEVSSVDLLLKQFGLFSRQKYVFSAVDSAEENPKSDQNERAE